MRLVDLSQTLENGMSVFPGAPDPIFETIGHVEDGDNYTLIKFQMTTHTGTHIDCNSHTVAGGFRADTKDINFFAGRGIVIDCSAYDRKTEIGMKFLEKYDLRDKEYILFHTGWGKNWGKEGFWTDFPVLSDEVIEYLRDNKTVKGFGIDCGTIDPLPDEKLSKHVKLFQEHKTVIENLTNMESLFNKDFIFIALPLKIKNGEGSPIRAVAMIQE